MTESLFPELQFADQAGLDPRVGVDIKWEKHNLIDTRAEMLTLNNEVNQLLLGLSPAQRLEVFNKWILDLGETDPAAENAYLRLRGDQGAYIFRARAIQALFSAENFFLLDENDRHLCVNSILAIYGADGYNLRFLIDSCTPYSEEITRYHDFALNARVVFPEVLTPAGYLIAQAVLRDDKLLSIYFSSNARGQRSGLITLGIAFGLFEGDVGLEYRRKLTPYLKSLSWLAPYERDLLLDTPNNQDSSQLKRLKYFGSGVLQTIALTRRMELPHTPRAEEIDAAISDKVDEIAGKQLGHSSGLESKPEIDDDARKSAILASIQSRRDTRDVLSKEFIIRAESSRNLATAMRKIPFGVFNSNLLNLMKTVHSDLPEYTDTYFKSVLNRDTVQILIRVLSEVVSNLTTSSQNHNGSEHTRTRFLTTDEGKLYLSKCINLLIESQNKVPLTAKYSFGLGSFFTEHQKFQDRPLEAWIFLLAFVEKALFLNDQNLSNPSESLFTYFKVLASHSLNQHFDKAADHKPVEIDIDDAPVTSQDAFDGLKEQSLTRLATIPGDRNLIGFNNPNLQDAFRKRVIFAQKFNEAIKSQGVSAAERSSLSRNIGIAFDVVPLSLPLISLTLSHLLLRSHDRADLAELLRIAPTLLPGLISLYMLARPSARFLHREIQLDFDANIIDREYDSFTLNTWQSIAQEQIRQRNELINRLFKVYLIVFVMIVFGTTYFATELNEDVQNFVDETIQDVFSPETNISSSSYSSPTSTPDNLRRFDASRGERDSTAPNQGDENQGLDGETSQKLNSDGLPDNSEALAQQEAGSPIFEWEYRGENPPSFWINFVSDIAPDPQDPAVILERSYHQPIAVRSSYVTDKRVFDQSIEDYLDKGYLVRKNLSPSDGFYETPAGFELIVVEILNGVNVASQTNPQSSPLEGYGMTGSAETVALIYQERVSLGSVGDSRYFRATASTHLIPQPEIDGLIDESALRQLIQPAQVMFDQGLPPSVALTILKNHLSERGLDYGFNNFNSADYPSHLLLVEALLNQEELICSQFSWLLAVVMKQVGYQNIFLATGYANYGKEGFGGLSTDAHRVILYEENGQLYLFDATLPDNDQIRELGQIPIEDRDAYFANLMGQRISVSDAIQYTLLGTGVAITGTILLKLGKNKFKRRKVKAQTTESELNRGELPEQNSQMTEEDRLRQIRSSIAPEVFRVAKHITDFYQIHPFYEINGARRADKDQLPKDLAIELRDFLMGLPSARNRFGDFPPNMGAQLQQKLISGEALSYHETTESLFDRIDPDLLRNVFVNEDVPATQESEPADIQRLIVGLRLVEQTLASSDQVNPVFSQALEMIAQIIAGLSSKT